jgi:diaminopimelate epimerase
MSWSSAAAASEAAGSLPIAATPASAPVALPPAPSNPRAIVVLLKDRNTKQPVDAYEHAFLLAGFLPRFLPPLKFTFDEPALQRIATSLREDAHQTGGFVATSPRGVEAFCKILALLSDASSDSAPADTLALLSKRPFFVVSPASAAILASDPVAQRLGLRATVYEGVGTARQLGERIKREWEGIVQAQRDSSSSPSKHLLALVGEKRLPDLLEVLSGHVPTSEEIVYRTECAAVDGAATAVNSGEDSFMQQLLRVFEPPTSSSSSSSASRSSLPALPPTYIVFFSPSCVETFFAQVEHYAEMSERQRRLLRLDSTGAISSPSSCSTSPFRYACIGPTSAAAFRAHFTSTHQPVPEVLVAEKPSAEMMLQVVEKDWTRQNTETASSLSSSLEGPILFFKYHGTLNDYVLLDGFVRHYSKATLAHLAKQMCDRRAGIGSDGLLYVTSGRELSLTESPSALLHLDPAKSHLHGRMYMFNTDGSEAEMCGNGLRCVAKFVHDHKLIGTGVETLHLLTGAGEKIARIHCDSTTGKASLISLDLGRPVLSDSEESISLSSGTVRLRTMQVSMGNPHSIVVLPDAAALEAVDVETIGREMQTMERHRETHGVNVTFVAVREATPSSSASSASSSSEAYSLTLDLRTYERGNGETWSCGSGLSAAVASVLARRPRSGGLSSAEAYSETVRVVNRGGQLLVTCQLRDRTPASTSSSNGSASSVILRDVLAIELSGPAVEVFQGSCTLQSAK